MSGAVDFHDRTVDRFLEQYRNDPDFVDRLDAWTRALTPVLLPDVTALDLGCGGGTLALWAASRGARVTAVDGSPAMIAAAMKAATGTSHAPVFLERTLPADIEGAPFDVVFSSSLLEYLDDTPEIDTWVAGLVKPGGVLTFSLPNRPSLYRMWERVLFAMTGRPPYLAHVKRSSTVGATCARFRALGFSAMAVRYYAHRPLLSRLLRGLLPARLTDNLFLVVLRKN